MAVLKMVADMAVLGVLISKEKPREEAYAILKGSVIFSPRNRCYLQRKRMGINNKKWRAEDKVSKKLQM
jgi:hypothetical protein